MKTEDFDVVVMGLGIMGISALYHLSKKKIKVCGIEQYAPGHSKGSSHGETRIIRKAVFEGVDYYPIINRSYEIWKILEKETKKELLSKCGTLIIGDKNSSIIRGTKDVYNKYGLKYNLLNQKKLGNKFSMFSLKNKQVSIFDPEGGFLHAEKCIKAFQDQALKNGVKIFENEKIISWEGSDSEIIVKTDKREFKTKKLIITVGPWAKSEMESLGVKLKIIRKILFWYNIQKPNNYIEGKFPVFLYEEGKNDVYGFPIINKQSMKIAQHFGGHEIDSADEVNRSLSERDEQNLKEIINELIPELKLSISNHSVCMYSMTEDENGIIDRHPKNKNVIIGTGFSGHGFKFSAAFGEILMNLALNKKVPFNIDFLSFKRFKSQKLSSHFCT